MQQGYSIFIAHALSWLFWCPLWSQDGENPPEALNQTIIEAEINDTKRAGFNYVKEKSDDQKAGDAAMLFHIPGLTLNERGPLGIAQIHYRGLSSNRFRIDLEGLSLNNPINGLSDANSLFLFAAKRLDSNAQSLKISLPEIDRNFARGIVGFGSENTFKLAASSGARIDNKQSIFTATQFSSTNGRFSFYELSDAKSKKSFVRENNDQHRIQALSKYNYKSATGSSHILAAVNAHEGGSPGFAFAPTKSLRTNALFSGISAGFSKNIKKSKLSVILVNSFFDHENIDNNKSNRFTTSTHELTLGLDNLVLPKWLDLQLTQNFVVEKAYSVDKTRIGGGFWMKRNMNFEGSLRPKVFTTFGMMGYENHGLLFKKDLGVSIEPLTDLVISTRAVRSQRLPTFMELYSNNRFLSGNEDLKKESIWDFELSFDAIVFESMRLQLTGYFGFIGNTIVYIPFKGTRLRPENTDSAKHYGLDIAFSYEPNSWLLIESKNALLKTKMRETNASLPQSPPFLGLTSLRIGPSDVASVTISSKYKGPSFATIYGSLRSPPYIIFDGVASLQASQFFTLSFSVNNIFNVKTARDSYEMPLPGTTYFAQIELGS